MCPEGFKQRAWIGEECAEHAPTLFRVYVSTTETKPTLSSLHAPTWLDLHDFRVHRGSAGAKGVAR